MVGISGVGGRLGAHHPLSPMLKRPILESASGKRLKGFQETTDALIPVQIRPGTAQPYHDPPTAHPDFRRHLDEQRPPGAGLAFTQRIVPPPPSEITPPRFARQGFHRYRRRLR